MLDLHLDAKSVFKDVMPTVLRWWGVAIANPHNVAKLCLAFLWRLGMDHRALLHRPKHAQVCLDSREEAYGPDSMTNIWWVAQGKGLSVNLSDGVSNGLSCLCCFASCFHASSCFQTPDENSVCLPLNMRLSACLSNLFVSLSVCLSACLCLSTCPPAPDEPYSMPPLFLPICQLPVQKLRLFASMQSLLKLSLTSLTSPPSVKQPRRSIPSQLMHGTASNYQRPTSQAPRQIPATCSAR